MWKPEKGSEIRVKGRLMGLATCRREIRRTHRACGESDTMGTLISQTCGLCERHSSEQRNNSPRLYSRGSWGLERSRHIRHK